MIILVKGPRFLNQTEFAQRLAEHLDLPKLPWPIDEKTLEEWAGALGGWQEADPEFFFSTRFVDIDRVVAIVFWRHRLELPPAPSGPNVSRQDFERWRDKNAQLVAETYQREVFDLCCGMIDAVDHAVVSGSLLGSSPRDTMLSRMLQFKYGQVPLLRLLLKSPAGAGFSGDHNQQLLIECQRKDFTAEEFLKSVWRNDDGSIGLAPALKSARVRQVFE